MSVSACILLKDLTFLLLDTNNAETLSRDVVRARFVTGRLEAIWKTYFDQSFRVEIFF